MGFVPLKQKNTQGSSPFSAVDEKNMEPFGGLWPGVQSML
jgi:hypothetical protein